MVTPRTCRLCPGSCEPNAAWPICPACWPAYRESGEARRHDGIMSEEGGTMHQSRADGCVTDYITRILAEREVERGRA